MRFNKKIVVFFIVLSFLTMNIHIPAVAQSHTIMPKLVFDKQAYLPGSVVTMALRLSETQATDKTNSISFDIEYDGSTFELETNTPDNDIKDGYIQFTTKYNTGAGSSKKISLMHVNMSNDTALKEGGDIFSVKFKVKDNATDGAKVFKLKPIKMLDSNFNSYNINDGETYANAIEIGQASSIKVLINGEVINFDVPPQIVGGRTLVPLRKIFESLGATVNWDSSSKTITGIKENTTVVLKVDSSDATVNEQHKTLDVPATIINSRTLVPARFISESLGANVSWDGETRTVTISQ